MPKLIVSGVVYNEVGGSPTSYDSGTDTGISGITVKIVCDGITHTSSAVTTGTGTYTIPGIPEGAVCAVPTTDVPGTYTATETPDRKTVVNEKSVNLGGRRT